MKVTIDVPAPTQSLELLSRLRQKIRNYKTSMKQLQRAHFVTKTLLDRAEERNIIQKFQIRQLQGELERKDQRIAALEQAYGELVDMGLRTQEPPPIEPVNEAERDAFAGTECDDASCLLEEYDNMIQTVAGNGNGAAHSRVAQSGAI